MLRENPDQLPTCHVVTHVHWDREWYRPFEGFRSRLLQLVERVCDAVESGSLASFHLDGQTIILDDVSEVAPELGARLLGLVDRGLITIGPWHVLADNQLVSAENLVRNLFRARRSAGTRISSIGYSPDAFGHPADLPRVLRGFGISTALVWRGAPPEFPRFRWRSPDGSEVFTVNQAYHEAEVLWHVESDPQALSGFLTRERNRLAAGPWLLLNGGDHLFPQLPTERLSVAAQEVDPSVNLQQSNLAAFFTAAQEASTAEGLDLPVVVGELRHLGGYLTFLLPGTLSARGTLKQMNDRAQVLLERFVEPTLAASTLVEGLHLDAPQLAHAWDVLLQNAPHDSICGCSVDEVHRATTVRAESVIEISHGLVHSLARRAGHDTRTPGKQSGHRVDVLVRSGDGDVADVPVVVEIVTASHLFVAALLDPAGNSLPVEVEYLGATEWFEADLDHLADTHRGSRHRLAFLAPQMLPFGSRVFSAVLSTEQQFAPRLGENERQIRVEGTLLELRDDLSVDITTVQGTVFNRVGELRDGGDRGDSYNYDPPLNDACSRPRLVQAHTLTSPVRSRIVADGVMETPCALSGDRDSRDASMVDVPVRITVERWVGDPAVRWSIDVNNTAKDHRLRWHVPVTATAETDAMWLADTHWSVVDRPFTPVVGELPNERGREASIGTSPAHTYARAGTGDAAVAVLLDALPEVQGVTEDGQQSLAVTLLRAVGWLSRFDLRTRTAGAGPAFAVPDAQAMGIRSCRIAVLLGPDAVDELEVAKAASRHHVPPWVTQLRTGSTGLPVMPPAPRVQGALVSAFKPAENGDGVILRLFNPTRGTRKASVEFPPSVQHVQETRLDESMPEDLGAVSAQSAITLELLPFAVRTLRLLGPTNPAASGDHQDG